METKRFVSVDGNEAVANIAHLCCEVAAIYPITPSSNLGEMPDAWAAAGRKNIFGTVPSIVEMQSEAGAAGAVHGSLQAGALTTTFTASQGLLLMIPNMFKIAGELTSTVFHVTARTVATHALSIFGDHSDVMACRSTGWAMLSSDSVQEAQDMALIAHAATLEARLPFLHFYDGFRISHEVNKIEQLTDAQVAQMIDMDLVAAHRGRALSPEKPQLRGTAQNPDVFFQAREACNKFYDACPAIVQKTMDKFAGLFGRQYHLFDYVGAPDAERVIVCMGSGSGVIEETVDYLSARGEKIGLVKVHLFRPLDKTALLAVIPKSVKKIAVLDRTKEPGSNGEPLYQDIVTAMAESWNGPLPKIIGGRYGLSSKEFTPAHVAAVYNELSKAQPKPRFIVGIKDDVTFLSLDSDDDFSTEGDDVTRAVFFGLGADGTVSANRSSVKIIGEFTPRYSQGYFVYDSRKAGSVTTSHVRFSPRPIKGSYLVHKANFVACHQFHFTERIDMLSMAMPGATFLLNSPYGPDEVWDHLPAEVQKQIVDKKLKFYVVDAFKVAREADLGARINTVMQTCFFKLANVIPADEAISHIKASVKALYGKKGGGAIVDRNNAAIDMALAGLREVKVLASVNSKFHMLPPVPDHAPAFVKDVLGMMIANRGDELPVSAMPIDGTFPTGTTQYEKRSIAQDIPIWDPKICIQCGLCSLGCPHACIRMKVFEPSLLQKGPGGEAPAGFKATDYKAKEYPGWKFVIQVAPDDCTGCGLCVDVCPAKDKSQVKHKAIDMEPKMPNLDRERAGWDFFLTIPDADRTTVKLDTVKGSQFLLPLFEFSGACAGCGETPYIKLITQLFGDRMLIGNATGCSSIYGGNLPCTPYTQTPEGKGPAWSNSLFEDCAEFGMGFRLAIDQQLQYGHVLLAKLSGQLGDEIVNALINNKQENDAEIILQRSLVATLKQRLAGIGTREAKDLAASADYLVRRSVWSFGGDGWAYDIGFGGLDHVFATGRDVNILVLDTEVYSNTGGQASKSTSRGAVAKFAAAGKPGRKKDLGMIAMAYGNVYVGQIAMGANPAHALKVIREAESYRGTSLIIAFSHCISWGINMTTGMQLQKEAVNCGYWPLYHFDPRDEVHPFHLDSKKPTGDYKEFAMKEARFNILTRSKPETAARLFHLAQDDINARWHFYEQLAGVDRLAANGGASAAAATQAEKEVKA